MKKGVGVAERDREKTDRDKDRRKKEKKQRKDITKQNILGTMSSEDLLRLDEVCINIIKSNTMNTNKMKNTYNAHFTNFRINSTT